MQLFIEKRQFFQSKQPMTKEHPISLNWQFTVVLNGIICFSVQFCNNSLLVFKMRLKYFLSQAKRYNIIFQWQEDINVVVISTLSSTKLCLSFLIFEFLAKIFGETFIMSLKSTWFPKALWWKPFTSRAKQFKRNLRHDFADERQLKIIMPK